MAVELNAGALTGSMALLADGWQRYGMAGHWWLYAMTVIWLVFTLVLFVLEPLVLHKWFLENAERAPERTFAVIQVMHWMLTMLSLATVAGAVAGSHGWVFV